MNRTQLTAMVAKKTNSSKAEAEKFINAVLGTITDEITEGEGEVAIPDFGRFFVKQVPARQGINPQTREKIEIEAHDKVVFKPSEFMCYYSRKHTVEK